MDQALLRSAETTPLERPRSQDCSQVSQVGAGNGQRAKKISHTCNNVLRAAPNAPLRHR